MHFPRKKRRRGEGKGGRRCPKLASAAVFLIRMISGRKKEGEDIILSKDVEEKATSSSSPAVEKARRFPAKKIEGRISRFLDKNGGDQGGRVGGKRDMWETGNGRGLVDT